MAEKLNGNMSGMDAIPAMSDGNPGAMMVLMGMMQGSHRVYGYSYAGQHGYSRFASLYAQQRLL